MWSEAGRRLVFPAVTGAWEAAFALTGLFARPRAARISPTGNDRMLVIAPHPDDETLGCGGTIAGHARAGDRVEALIVTDGGGSRAGGHGREEMRRLRAREAGAAIAHLTPLPPILLGLPEGDWAADDLHPLLRAEFERVRPGIVYAPSVVDFHPDHLRTAAATARALSALAVPPRAVRVYEVQVPLTPILVNALSDIRATLGAKRRALSEYRTQAGSLGASVREGRYLRRLYGAPGAVEVFWEMTPAAYCRMVEGGHATTGTFRGLRPRPFGDGLAWVVGLSERRRLAGLASGGAGQA